LNGREHIAPLLIETTTGYKDGVQPQRDGTAEEKHKGSQGSGVIVHWLHCEQISVIDLERKEAKRRGY
jgi:hypothetical protein